MIEQSSYLFFTEGSSDKEYHLHLMKIDDGWCAYYANGPRGRVGRSKPIKDGVFTYAVAAKLYADKLKNKLKDGYTPSESGIRFSNTEHGQHASGHEPQLPTSAQREQADSMVDDDCFVAQEKANGERRTIEVISGRVRGINKLGLYVNLPENLVHAFASFGDAVFDGEQVGSVMHVFDLLSYRGKDMRALPFGQRYQALEEDVLASMYKPENWPILTLAPAFTSQDKMAMLERVQKSNGEGLVFKRVDAPYEGGRSKSVFKYKFIETCTCIVLGVNQQRSVQLGLLNGAQQKLQVGNVTIPANFPVPAQGDLVEVQYLYFNPEGAFEQPVYLGPRSDILANEAMLSQITRLKPGVGMDEMGRRLQLAVAPVVRAAQGEQDMLAYARPRG